MEFEDLNVISNNVKLRTSTSFFHYKFKSLLCSQFVKLFKLASSRNWYKKFQIQLGNQFNPKTQIFFFKDSYLICFEREIEMLKYRFNGDVIWMISRKRNFHSFGWFDVCFERFSLADILFMIFVCD